MAEDALFASFGGKPAVPSTPSEAAPKKRGASPSPIPVQSESAKKARVEPEASGSGTGTGTGAGGEKKFAVTDEFEQEATTSVPTAGEAENLILSHQVSFQSLIRA